MADDRLDRIARGAGVPELPDVLADRIAPADLPPLLLDAYRRRSARRTAAQLLAQHERDATVAPAELDARRTNAIDGLAFAAAAGFEALELAPVCPLATNAVLGGISQHNVLTTIRNTEVLADPTTSLALECARRRRHGEPVVRLCASHRVLRMQPFDVPGFTRHFRLFALTSAGRATPSHGFEIGALRDQLAVHLAIFASLREEGCACDDIVVEISDSRVARAMLERSGVSLDELRSRARAHAPGAAADLLREHGVRRLMVRDPGPHLDGAGLTGSARLLEQIRRDVFGPLQERFPAVEFLFDLTRAEALDYYSGPMLKISATDAHGVRYAPSDGGFTTWTQQLLSDRKERLLTTGLGLSLIATRFAADPEGGR